MAVVRTLDLTMTNQNDFAKWATGNGLDDRAIEQLLDYAATPEQMKAAYEAMEPAPPIYTLNGIRKLHDGNEMGISPAHDGFMIVGGCPNGDPIALDIADDVGSVWYLGHETMHKTPLREIAVRVADDLDQLIDGICNDDDFPIDFYQAKQRQDKS